MQLFQTYFLLHYNELSLNKNDDKFITGSYEQTCIVCDTSFRQTLQKLKGYKNVIYSIYINLAFADKVGTASFIQTIKLWNVENGKYLATFRRYRA